MCKILLSSNYSYQFMFYNNIFVIILMGAPLDGLESHDTDYKNEFG